MSTAASAWGTIESWLRANAPDLLGMLLPPASEDQIAAAEHALGCTLPPSYADSLRVHDGQENRSPLVAGWYLLPLADVVRDWNMLRGFAADGTFDPTFDFTVQADPEVAQVEWAPSWIPVAHDAGGSLLCIDLSPRDGGTLGQVITYYSDAPQRRVVADSFVALLDRVATWMTSGRVTVIASPELVVEGEAFRMLSLEFEGWADRRGA